MADEADQAARVTEELTERGIAAARVPIPEGVPGECVECGDWSARLVGGWCAPCRDENLNQRKRKGGQHD